MSFCPTPNSDIAQFNNDLFDFTRKLRLRYHFRDNDSDEDTSIVKLPSNFTPLPYADIELETMINTIKHLQVTKKQRYRPNLSAELQTGLQSLMDRISRGEIIIKSADKGDVTVVMSRDYYLSMCMHELSKPEFYKIHEGRDPSARILALVRRFAKKHTSILTPKEVDFLINKNYRMAYFYSMPKLHKSEEINQSMNSGSEEYLHLSDFSSVIEGRPIVGGPCFFTSGLSEMIDIILKPIVSLIPHILRDSFDLINRCSKQFADGTLLGTCDVKSLYTNLSFDLVINSVQYWVTKHRTDIPLLQRFNLPFICEGLHIILENNFFEFNDIIFQQIKGFAMGTKAAVQCANLAVAYLEVKMFDILPSLYPLDFVDYIIRNYFRLLDDIIYAWLSEFDITQFYEVFSSLDDNLNFIFSELSNNVDFLDIHLNIDENGSLVMDVYHKPTDSHNYLNYTSCHPQHTRDNIALSLAKRIIRIVTENNTTQQRLGDLKHHLMLRGHPVKSINDAFTKVFQPKEHPSTNHTIVFTSTFDPNLDFNKRKISTILDNINGGSCRKAFRDCRIVISSRQPKCLRNYLISSKFSSRPPTRKNSSGLFQCKNCVYHHTGFVKPCKSFSFGKDNEFRWEYRRFFNCESTNVIYLLKCANCWMFYVGETKDLKSRISKHKSDVKNLQNTNCVKLALHLRICSKLRTPFFRIFPFFYVDDQQRRRFIEKRFIKDYNAPLNEDT